MVYAYLLHGPVILLYRQTSLPELLNSDWQVGLWLRLPLHWLWDACTSRFAE